MVGLVDIARKEVYCGASIISDRYILSAGHCVYKRSVTELGALVGDHDLTSGIALIRNFLVSCSHHHFTRK